MERRTDGDSVKFIHVSCSGQEDIRGIRYIRGNPSKWFFGYVALKVDSASSLLSLPISSASTSSLDLGTISKSGDTGITDNSATASDFTLTAGQLGTLARTD